MSQFFGVDQFECLSLNIVKYSILCFVFFILIFDAKDPHVSEANDVSQKVRILLFYTHICGIVAEGKVYLVDRSRLLVFARVNNEILKEWVLFDFIIGTFLIEDKVNVWRSLFERPNLIADCVDVFLCPHFSELSFGVVSEVEVQELQSLLRFIGMEQKFGVIVALLKLITLFELMLPFNSRFGIASPQISYVIVKQIDVVAILSHPTQQFALSVVFDVFSNYFSIHCGASLFASFQVNQPKCWIIFVQYHNLLRTDHINRNIPNIFTFHFLPQQGLSVAV